MIHELDLSVLPDITSMYIARRRTVWQIVDPDTLLIFAAEGRCSITIDSRTYTLGEGCLMIVPANQHYVRRPIDDELCTLYYVHLHLKNELSVLSPAEASAWFEARHAARTRELVDGYQRGAMQSHRYLVAPLTDLSARKDEFIALWEEARDSSGSPHGGRTLASMAITRILLMAAEMQEAYMEDQIDVPSALPEPYAKLRRVIGYIKLHAKEPITLDDLCAQCSYSKQHLIRVFREEFGKTPKAYISEHRINCAKELIYRDPYLSIKEVADEMGFEDAHYFTRLFTKIAGISPSAYKRHLLTFDQSSQ